MALQAGLRSRQACSWKGRQGAGRARPRPDCRAQAAAGGGLGPTCFLCPRRQPPPTQASPGPSSFAFLCRVWFCCGPGVAAGVHGLGAEAHAGLVLSPHTAAAHGGLRRGLLAPWKRPHGPLAPEASSVAGQSIGHGLLRSVDPDDVQVAIVDALFVLVGEAGAPSRTAVPQVPLGHQLLPRASRAGPLACRGGRSLPSRAGHIVFTVPLGPGCTGGPGHAGPASTHSLGARHESCGGGHCEPQKEPQPGLHEPGSGTGAPARQAGRWWPGRAGRAARRGGSRPPARWLAASWAAAGSWVRRSPTFSARCPSPRRTGRLWARAFLAPHHPPRLPAPRRGWSCGAGPLNPGRPGGRRPGSGEPAKSSAAGGAPRTARGGGGTAAARPRARARAHTHSRAAAGSHPGTCGPRPGEARARSQRTLHS